MSSCRRRDTRKPNGSHNDWHMTTSPRSTTVHWTARVRVKAADAAATAKILARPHGVDPIPQDGLREISHGHWEGMTRQEVEEKFGEEYGSWEADPFTFAPKGGESGISVLARALPVIREIVVTHKDRNIAVVSHKATIRLILSSLLGFDERGYRDRLDQAPACLNILDFKNSVHARLMLFNDISHYSDHPHRPEKHLSRWWDLGNTAGTGTD